MEDFILLLKFIKKNPTSRKVVHGAGTSVPALNHCAMSSVLGCWSHRAESRLGCDVGEWLGVFASIGADR